MLNTIRCAYLLLTAILWTVPMLAQVDTEDIVCNLENTSIRQYLDAAKLSYKDIYEHTSIVNRYDHNDGNTRKDFANMPTISLPSTYARPLRVEYGYEGDTDIIGSIMVDSDAEKVSIPSLIPGKSYFYHVKDGNENTVRQGRIQTEGRVRMFNFNSIQNMRDLGGWPTSDGYILSFGKLYRGSELKGDVVQATAEDIAALRAMGIHAELDFRDKNAACIQNGVSALGYDCPYLFIDMEDTGTQFADNKEDYARAFRFLLDNLRNGYSTYIHCVYGADRTGMFCSLLEALAGVRLADIYKDFELSSFSSIVSTRSKLYLNRRLYNIKGTFPPSESIGQLMYEYAIEDLRLTNAEVDEFARLMTGREYVPTGVRGMQFHGDGTYECYGPDGTRRRNTLRGFNLVRLADGSIRKVVIRIGDS